MTVKLSKFLIFGKAAQCGLYNSGANRNPVTAIRIPAFAGMTGKIAHHFGIRTVF